MLLVATELHLRNIWKFFRFVRHASRSKAQALKAEGSLHVWLGNKGFLTGYTLTAWKDKESMQQFRNNGAHKEAMKEMARLSNRYRTLVWEADAIPNPNEAKKRLEGIAFKELK